MSQRKYESRRLKVARETERAELSGVMSPPVLVENAAPEITQVESAVAASREWLLDRQTAAGWWCAELEADTTLESYFILFKTLFGHRDDPKIPKLAKVIRREMLPEGGWNIFLGGPAEI